MATRPFLRFLALRASPGERGLKSLRTVALAFFLIRRGQLQEVVERLINQSIDHREQPREKKFRGAFLHSDVFGDQFAQIGAYQ